VATLNTKRLDDAVALLRKPAAKRRKAARHVAYIAGLKTLGWTMYTDPKPSDRNRWSFHKDGKLIRVYEGDRIEICMRDQEFSEFKLMPAKAKRNIALAGQ
jgi:hypothetical protein